MRRPALLLVAQIDSETASLGAARSAAPMAALLETTVRALRAGTPPANDILVLFADGERVGSLGMQAFAEQHPWAREVGLALRFDGMGSSGALELVNTAGANTATIDGWLHATPDVRGSSLMREVHALAPGAPRIGALALLAVPVLQFANRGRPFDHAGVSDTPGRLESATLQHTGESMLRLARHFGGQRLAPPGDANASGARAGVLHLAPAWHGALQRRPGLDVHAPDWPAAGGRRVRGDAAFAGALSRAAARRIPDALRRRGAGHAGLAAVDARAGAAPRLEPGRAAACAPGPPLPGRAVRGVQRPLHRRPAPGDAPDRPGGGHAGGPVCAAAGTGAGQLAGAGSELPGCLAAAGGARQLLRPAFAPGTRLARGRAAGTAGGGLDTGRAAGAAGAARRLPGAVAAAHEPAGGNAGAAAWRVDAVAGPRAPLRRPRPAAGGTDRTGAGRCRRRPCGSAAAARGRPGVLQGHAELGRLLAASGRRARSVGAAPVRQPEGAAHLRERLRLGESAPVVCLGTARRAEVPLHPRAQERPRTGAPCRLHAGVGKQGTGSAPARDRRAPHAREAERAHPARHRGQDLDGGPVRDGRRTAALPHRRGGRPDFFRARRGSPPRVAGSSTAATAAGSDATGALQRQVDRGGHAVVLLARTVRGWAGAMDVLLHAGAGRI
ncbi:M28 family peptidase [Massilia sp. Dwa41.01b]|nr:M28 family peptidase [Massilia sp. Dwa41.01b]